MKKIKKKCKKFRSRKVWPTYNNKVEFKILKSQKMFYITYENDNIAFT